MSKLIKAFGEYLGSHTKSLKHLTYVSLFIGLCIGLLTHAGHQDNWFSSGVYSFAIFFLLGFSVITLQFLGWYVQLKRS
jgi:hypothetical protein